jgi:hypothetical protein
MALGVRHILLETVFEYYNIYCIELIIYHIKLLSLKYLFVPIFAFHMCAVGYEVYRHPQFFTNMS